MTDDERFELIVTELGRLMIALGDLAFHVVLIGGQVPALIGRQRHGSALISIQTDTGITIDRAYSFEPDLLIDAKSIDFQGERLPVILRQCGFERTKSARWAKSLGTFTMELDLFRPKEHSDVYDPTPLTELPDGDLVLGLRETLEVQTPDISFQISIPKPLAFLAMKLKAKQQLRPHDRKDSFDIYAYAQMIGIDELEEALTREKELGDRIREGLDDLFGDIHAVGVQDVLHFSNVWDPEERALLAQAVVDCFRPLVDASI